MSFSPPTFAAAVSPALAPEWDDVMVEYERRVEPFTLEFARDLLEALGRPQASAEDNAEGDGTKLKLLEVGCGSGGAALLAASVGYDVTATDVSPSMVERTRRRATGAGYDIRCVVTDGQSLPTDWTGTFDRVLANFSVIFFTDPALGLREIRRCLKLPSGRMALSAWGDASETAAFRIFPDAAARIVPELAARGKPRRITGSRASLESLLREEAGFGSVDVVGPISHTLRVSSPEEYYKRFALTSPPTMQMISEMDTPTAAAFNEQVLELVRERGGQFDGSVAIGASAYFAFGS